MRCSNFCFLTLIGSFILSSFAGPIVPEPWKFEDLPQWEAGVRGGIPHYETKKSISASKLGKSKDPADCIQKAIDSITPPGAVLLPEGTYELTRPLIMKTGVVLRGMGSTHLRFTLQLPDTHYPKERPALGSIRFEGSMEKLERPIATDHFKGASWIALANTTGLAVGDMIEIFSENDPHLMYTESRWNKAYAKQALSQIIEIQSVSDEGVAIDTPLRLNFYTELNPRIRKILPVENAGIESLSIERVDTSIDSAIGFENALNCWVKDSQSYMASRGHIWMNHSRFISIESTEVHHGFDYGSGGNGYGIVAGNGAVDCLIVDNITHNLRHSLMAKKGSNGNVFAFNYSFDRQRDPEGARLLCDISLHGHYPYQNLFEGNVAEFIDIADHWGPIGPDTTFFRNRIRERIMIRDHSHHMRLIGNVVEKGAIEADSTVHHTSLLQNQLLSQANHSKERNETALPASLFYKDKPHFWGDLPWPSIGPGTDNEESVLIPAQLRWVKKSAARN